MPRSSILLHWQKQLRVQPDQLLEKLRDRVLRFRMRRERLARQYQFTCLWLLLLLLSGSAAESHAAGASLSDEGQLSSSDGATRWLEATPLAGKEEPQILLDEDLAAPLELEGGRWMICVGGETTAVRCGSTLSEGGSEAVPESGPGTEIVGTVLVGGRAAPGARISVVPEGLASRRRFTVPLAWDRESKALVRDVGTDAEGKFRIPPLVPGDYLLEVVPKGGQIQTVGPFSLPAPERLLARGQDPAEVQAVWDLGELSFDSGMSVEVLVTDLAGAPLPRAQVGGAQGEPPEVIFFETEADEEGKAVLSGLDSSTPVQIVCVAQGYARMSGRFEVPPSSTHCAMEELASASGEVLDESEEPVHGAVVALAGLDRNVRTDQDGVFSFNELTASTYELEISAPGFRVETIEITLEAGESLELEPLVLHPGETLLGEVVEASGGNPLEGATVEVIDPPGGASTVTDEDGLFELEADPDHPPVVRIEAAGYPRHREEVPASAFEDGERVRFELRPGGRIEVRAWSQEGDAPCAACEFSISGHGERWPKLVTGSEGAAISGLLHEGRYAVTRVQVRSTGSVVRVSSGLDVRWADVAAGETVTVEFGEPTLPLQVQFRPAPPSDWMLWARGADWNRQAEALGAGVFRLRRRPGESLDLILRGPDGESLHAGTLPAEFDRETLEKDLPAGRVEGRLVQAEAPAQGVDLAVLDARQGTRRATVRSGEDGAFAVPFLPTGTYYLVVGSHVLRTFSVAAGSDVVLNEIPVDAADD
jgi:hypothetical protein